MSPNLLWTKGQLKKKLSPQRLVYGGESIDELLLLNGYIDDKNGGSLAVPTFLSLRAIKTASF